MVVAFLWPDTFVSQAVMRITPQQISDRLVPTVVNMQMQQRLQQMQQEILSRGSLAELIQRPSLDLYRKERARYPMEDVIQDMRNKAINIQTVEVDTPGQGRMASRLYHFVLLPRPLQGAGRGPRTGDRSSPSRTSRVQRNQATPDLQFLTDELKQAKDKMDALEARRSPSSRTRTWAVCPSSSRPMWRS